MASAEIAELREEMRSDFRVFGEGLGSTNRRIEELRSWGGRVVALEDRLEGMEAKRG